MRHHWEAIVVGLGAAGSAALYQLARRGVKVLGLDRFQPPHDRGSSHGETRITRVALGEGAHYVPLVRRSHEIWRELEAATGQSLLHQVGGLIFGSAVGGARAHGTENFLETTIQVAQSHGIEHEVLTAHALADRYPQFHFRGDETGYFEPGAGYLRPEACLTANLNEAQRLGARAQMNERMLSWQVAGQGIAVVTDRNRYEADRLILCAGPWLPGMISALGAKTRTFRQVLFWFEPDGLPELFRPDRLPVYIRLPDAESEMFYGFPLLGEPAAGLKIAGEHFNQPCQPDLVERDVSAAEQETMREVAARHFRIGSRCVRAVACQYTVTPDFDFAIDHLPETNRVWVASACSGHGFKHSVAVGEALAELATIGKSKFDLARFHLARLTGSLGNKP